MARRPSKGKAYTLFAADPGERTGVVLVRISDHFKPVAPYNGPRDFDVFDQDVWTVRECATFLESWIAKADLVAYEAWRLYKTHARAMIGNDMQPSQVVGMIRYVAWKHSKAIESNGAHVKKVALANMPPWLLEHMAKSSEQHDQDAIMHAWFVAMNHYYRSST